ncbi:MAG: 23S rRNA pseudouridine1911/1915/1917 synthase, partial [Gammaproteobacteria bacterium]
MNTPPAHDASAAPTNIDASQTPNQPPNENLADGLTGILTAEVPQTHDGQRFDQTLAAVFDQYSRSRLKLWIRDGLATVDGATRRPRDTVHAGQQLRLTLPAPVPGADEGGPDPQSGLQSGPRPEAIPIEVIYEDADILVINKAAGLVVHPGAGNPTGTLVNALLHFDPQLGAIPRAGIVHRLDKDTSGLLVIARTLPAHARLVEMLAERTIRREYLGVVAGHLTAGATVDAPIGRHPSRRTAMAVVGSGRHAITHYRVIERFGSHTFVRVRLETGRTHQIRVHMAHVGHVLVGDPVYGG